MKTILILLLLGSTAMADDMVVAKTTDIVPLHKCIGAPAMRMAIEAKLYGSFYLVSQYAGTPGYATVGMLDSEKKYSGTGRLRNAIVCYLGSKNMLGKDGFEHTIDLWQER